MGNCDSSIFLGGKEKGTLEELSKILGKETIDTVNRSVTRGSSPSSQKSYQRIGKDLMSMDELAVLDGSKCILQLRGVRPFLSDKYDITRHPNYKYLADANPQNALDIEKYISTRLRVKPDDLFEVYEFEAAGDE
jgi:type IV secretion system protein VirD4